LSANRRTPQPQGSVGKQDDLSLGSIESLGAQSSASAETRRPSSGAISDSHSRFIGIYNPSDTEWEARTREWADAFRAAMEPYFSGGVYVNHMQAELLDWQRAYHGDHYTRLRSIKQEHDPAHVFCFPQDLLQHERAAPHPRHERVGSGTFAAARIFSM
jgi:hypothetical protein